MIIIRNSTPSDGDHIIEIWCSSVDATHHFLSTQDRIDIEVQVRQFLPKAPLLVAVDSLDQPIGFMLLDKGHMEALFIGAESRGAGIGKALLLYATKLHPKLTTDVNEQNEQALGFYLYMGFEVTGRSEADDQGRPYPLLHLKAKS